MRLVKGVAQATEPLAPNPRLITQDEQIDCRHRKEHDAHAIKPFIIIHQFNSSTVRFNPLVLCIVKLTK